LEWLRRLRTVLPGIRSWLVGRGGACTGSGGTVTSVVQELLPPQHQFLGGSFVRLGRLRRLFQMPSASSVAALALADATARSRPHSELQEHLLWAHLRSLGRIIGQTVQ